MSYEQALTTKNSEESAEEILLTPLSENELEKRRARRQSLGFQVLVAACVGMIFIGFVT